VTYGQLIGGRRFNVTLTGASATDAAGTARIKSVQDLRLSGRPLPRYDIPPKVDGSLRWAVDVKLAGMVHARNVKPPFAGATLANVDESSVSNLPGFVRVVGAATLRSSSSASGHSGGHNAEGDVEPPVHHHSDLERLFDVNRDAHRQFAARRHQGAGRRVPGAAELSKRNTNCRFRATSLGPAHATAIRR
jgi:hypothetical protein